MQSKAHSVVMENLPSHLLIAPANVLPNPKPCDMDCGCGDVATLVENYVKKIVVVFPLWLFDHPDL